MKRRTTETIYPPVREGPIHHERKFRMGVIEDYEPNEAHTMNAEEFIKAWKEGYRFCNDKLKGEIVRRSGDSHWEMHINAEIIVFFDDVKPSTENEVVLLMDGDHAIPFCTYNWRVSA